MSSPLAIAAVTAVLLDLLNEGMVNNDISPVGSFKVSAAPPDRITAGPQEPNQLNLFLYQVTPNAGWRNVGLPSHDQGGARITNPPLALNLHYLLTAYGSDALNCEILLGYAMELLHDLRVVPRGAIRRALAPDALVNAALIPPDAWGRFAADLADQVEQIKITPHYPTADELTKLWTAMQSRYRPSVAYEVSVVLIEGRRPARTPLPVLTRGENDDGPRALPGLLSSYPALNAVTVADPDRQRAAAELGDTLRLSGRGLGGDEVVALFRHAQLDAPFELPAVVDASGASATVALPAPADAAAADWRAGIYGLALRIRAGARVTTTQEQPLALAPRIVSPLPLEGVRAADGSVTLTLEAAPPVHPGQRASLLVGGDEFAAPPPAAPSSEVKVTIADIAATPQPLPLRLRVDGVETQLVPDRKASPPRFDPAHAVTIP